MKVTSGPTRQERYRTVTSFSLDSCLPTPLACQDNALCTRLWIIRVKSLVSSGMAVDERLLWKCG
jgi:hypothetical protein